MQDRRRDVALFRYSLIREAADAGLTKAERGASSSTLCYQHGLSRTWPLKGVAAPNHPPGGCTPSLWAGPAASPTEEHVDEQAVLETGSSPRRLRSKAEEGSTGMSLQYPRTRYARSVSV